MSARTTLGIARARGPLAAARMLVDRPVAEQEPAAFLATAPHWTAAPGDVRVDAEVRMDPGTERLRAPTYAWATEYLIGGCAGLAARSRQRPGEENRWFEYARPPVDGRHRGRRPPSAP